MDNVSVESYSEIYKSAFKQLNEAWITKFFKIEEEDIATLNHPEKIIAEGGYIFVALLDGVPSGVCALKKYNNDTFEFSKMAVSESAQGKGVGHQLIKTAIKQAQVSGAKTIFLEGNKKLEASIHLYKKFGFQEVTTRKSHFERVNIIMELKL